METAPASRERPADGGREAPFVGRSVELALLEDAIVASGWPFLVLHLWGVGGIGKSTLLDQYQQAARAADMPFLLVDCRHIAPNPKDFTAAWNAHAAGLPEACPLGRRRWILALDTYEAFAPLDRWMRESFLPSLPSTCLVILSGRLKPAVAWAADLGWRSLSHSLELGTLDFAEVAELLTARAVPASAHEAVFRITSGHPLAAELVAAQVEADPAWDPGAASAEPAIFDGLVDRFLDGAPSPVHREALEIASIALFTNQDLLADLMPRADTYHRGPLALRELPHARRIGVGLRRCRRDDPVPRMGLPDRAHLHRQRPPGA